jgi:dihydrofolate synthase/folylpolyglutamate synthase
LITNIGFDHKDILGDTLAKIASEKAGIIKPQIPVIVSEKQKEIENVFLSKAESVGAPIQFASDSYSVEAGSIGLNVFMNGVLSIKELSLPLKGQYQFKNLPGVLNVIDVLNQNGLTITKENLVKGLEKVLVQTGLKGRWQQLGEKPVIMCDTGHNEDGVREVAKQISQMRFNKLHMVWGMVNDKEVNTILSMLPSQAHYYFCQALIPRAMDAHQLCDLASKYNLSGEVILSVNEAIKKAIKSASPDDLIFIGGSTFVVAEIENL